MKPLSHTKRKVYMFTLTVICLITVPFLVLYSLGYRLNDAWALIQTGGVYVNPQVSGAVVYVDDKKIEETGLFQRSILKQNLGRGKHKISILKEDYRYWEKTVDVSDRLVTEIHPLLLPKAIPEREIFMYFDSKNDVATSTKTILKNPEYTTVLNYFASSTSDFAIKETKKVDSVLLSSSTIEQRKNLIRRHKLEVWLENGKVKLAWTGDLEETPYYFCFAQNCIDKDTISLKENIVNVDFLPSRDDALLVSTRSAIYSVELDNRFGRVSEKIRDLKNPTDKFLIKNNSVFVKEGIRLFELF